MIVTYTEDYNPSPPEPRLDLMTIGVENDLPIGQGVEAIDTPALIADLDILESNLKRMSDYFAERHCRLRPHFKSHKCVELSRRQLAAGNVCGLTCAKLSEAEQLVAAAQSSSAGGPRARTPGILAAPVPATAQRLPLPIGACAARRRWKRRWKAAP